MQRGDSWLSLSGRKIDLRHQDHVEKILISTECDVTKPVGKPKRNIRSAPPNGGTLNMQPGNRKFAWSGGRRYGNRFILNKLSQSLRGKSFASSFHGFDDSKAIDESLPYTIKTSIGKSLDPSMNNGNSSHGNEPRPLHDSAPPKFRPTSASLPRAIRSIVIKLPNSLTNTSQSNTSSFGNAPSNNAIQSNFPSRPSGRLENFKRAVT